MTKTPTQPTEDQRPQWHLFGLRVTRDISIMDVITLAICILTAGMIYADFRNKDKEHDDRIVKLEQSAAERAIELRDDRNRLDQRLQNIEALMYKMLGRLDAAPPPTGSSHLK